MTTHLNPEQFKRHLENDTSAPQRAKLAELAEKGFKPVSTTTWTDETGVFVQHADGRFGLVTPRDGSDYSTSKLILAPRGKPVRYDHTTWQRA